jgi:hypothetical protein
MVVVHVSAMLVMVGVITYVRAPKLDPTAAFYVAAAGLSAIGLVVGWALYQWHAHRPRSEREWATAAIRAIYKAVDLAAKTLVGALAHLVGTQEVFDEVIEVAEAETRAPEKLVEVAAWIARVFGRTLIAVGFFMFWALIHLLIWSLDPDVCAANPDAVCAGAYRGVGAETTVGDFLYFAVNGALVNLPPDFIANSPAAHTAVVLELLSGLAVVTGFATRFLGMKVEAAAGRGPASAPVRNNR